MRSIEDRIGISTHFMPPTHGEDIFEAIRMVHSAGFKGFEIVPTLDQAQLGYPENQANVGIDLFEATPQEIARLKKALSVFDWVTVHSPHIGWNLCSTNRHLRRLTREYFDKCFELAIELKALTMTYHSGRETWGFIRTLEHIWQYNVDYAKHLIPRAKEMGVPVGFEITASTGSIDSLKYVCDRVDGWGINLDIGHAYIYGRTDQGFFAYLDEFQGRIVEVHHNGINHYWGGYMEHQPPHLNNTIDFQRAYERLKEIDYQGPIICEIQGQDITQVIKHCQESKDMIVGIWNGSLKLSQRWNITE